jgi:hypothetical protein
VAVSWGLIGPKERRSRGPSIVRVCEAPDPLEISSVIGPAPNSVGEAVTLSSLRLTEMLIGTGGRSSLRASSSPPHPIANAANANVASAASILIRPFPILLLRNERTLSEPDRLAAAQHLVE